MKISGKNIDDLDETWLRRYVIGFINQEPVLFATTIKENIRYGKPNASDEEVKNRKLILMSPTNVLTQIGLVNCLISCRSMKLLL